MCSIILNLTETGTQIAANRDELLTRPWTPPAKHWPEYPNITAGRDETAGGTWMALNQNGVLAAILNRHFTLGPAPHKRSRGELPLLALSEPTAQKAAEKILKNTTPTAYRPFNLILADATVAFFIRSLGENPLTITTLPPQTITMLTAGEPNDPSEPRIARHLPKFQTAPYESWPTLLADNTPPLASALNIPAPKNGFGTVCSSLLTLPTSGPPTWLFCAGPPHQNPFEPIHLRH